MFEDSSDCSRKPPHAQRARSIGVPFSGEPGVWNSITDVPGLEVGFTTIIENTPTVARTGVTVILPRGKTAAAVPCAAGVAVLNGNGELTGRSWIEESGQLQTPIAITNSHDVGAVHAGLLQWMKEAHPRAAAQWMLPVVGETWDGYLNSINAKNVREEHVLKAIEAASTGPIDEGNTGGGTGMNCYGFKGGTGTSSRIVRSNLASWTVGVLLQANFGSREELCVAGKHLGKESSAPDPMGTSDWLGQDLATAPGAGSVIVIVATDAPLLPDQCEALARRVPLGLARTGTTGSHFSGDIFLALSTGNPGKLTSSLAAKEIVVDSIDHIAWGSIDPFYSAVVQAVEEAVVNALVAAEDMEGRNGHKSYALPHAEIRAAFLRETPSDG